MLRATEMIDVIIHISMRENHSSITLLGGSVVRALDSGPRARKTGGCVSE